jgi:hypothetical protein
MNTAGVQQEAILQIAHDGRIWRGNRMIFRPRSSIAYNRSREVHPGRLVFRMNV